MIREKRKLAIKSLYASMFFIAVALATFAYKLIMILSGLAGGLFFAFYLFLSFKYWKCPSCGEQFPVVYSRMDERTECWHCLASLETEPAMEKERS